MVESSLDMKSETTAELNLYDIHFMRAADPKLMEDFWSEQVPGISWTKEPRTILNKSEPPFYGWFTDGELNTCYNCIDRHVDNKRGDQPALIYESPATKSSKVFTYKDLKEHTAKFAGVLAHHGVVKGDIVMIYMPVIPEAVFAMLACARLGAIHSLALGEAAKQIAALIKDSAPKIIVSVTCGVQHHKIVNYKQMLDEAIQLAEVPSIKKIIVAREQLKVTLIEGVDFDFYEELAKAKEIEPVTVLGKDPLYIIYTSGTSGTPKITVRDNGSHAVGLLYSMKYIFGLHPGDTFMALSDIAWVTGHSYGIYGPLLNGSTTILFEGNPYFLDAGILWRVAEKYKVRCIFVPILTLRNIRREDPEGKHIKQADLSSLLSFTTAGDIIDSPTWNWLLNYLPKSCLVNDDYGQTETGRAIATNFVNLHTFPVKPGSTTMKPVPGMIVTIIGEDSHHLPSNTLGNICLKLPLPPSSITTLYKNDKAFVDKYLRQAPGYFFTGDVGFLDEKGYLHVTSRAADMIRTAEYDFSPILIEEMLTKLDEDILEATVIGVYDDLKGHIIVGFFVLKPGVVNGDKTALEKELISKIREEICPDARFCCYCIQVEKLPRGNGGKILKNVLRDIFIGETAKIPFTTIAKERIIEGIKQETIKCMSFGK